MEILELSPESLAQALDPVEVQFAPLPQYLEATRKWQGIAGIERAPQGRLWATWYSGGCHEGPLNYVVLVTSDDDGVHWSGPCLVIDHMFNVTLKSRDDGRSAIHADCDDGELLLLPFRFQGNSLQIEFSTTEEGSIRVELRTFMDVPIKGYALEDCVELQGRNQTTRVTWRGDNGLHSLAGQLIRMRIEIKRADLFSLRFLNYD